MQTSRTAIPAIPGDNAGARISAGGAKKSEDRPVGEVSSMVRSSAVEDPPEPPAPCCLGLSIGEYSPQSSARSSDTVALSDPGSGTTST